jgi:hypothetical protein
VPHTPFKVAIDRCVPHTPAKDTLKCFGSARVLHGYSMDFFQVSTLTTNGRTGTCACGRKTGSPCSSATYCASCWSMWILHLGFDAAGKGAACLSNEKRGSRTVDLVRQPMSRVLICGRLRRTRY